MKAKTEVRSKVPRKANPQQVVYQLKHRVVIALNKIADRDTYQIGVQDLQKTAASLNPDGIIPFLSCLLDSDSEQKTAVRKECIRMMGVLSKIHGVLMGPHLGKMVTSIVKRLKDQDSVVRETCVETMGILAMEFGNSQVGGDDVFVLLVKPLFEALGEQNKHIQAGASMCLARVIDSMIDPPVSILQKMLARTMKLLKNPHFMAKPPILELNKSLIQAGGALSDNALFTAIRSIQDTLKDSDWTTRKAASLVLGEIGSSGGPFLAPFKESCVQALESCRFDKVKPVRDTVTQALRQWRNIEGQDMPDPSYTVSSVKDNLCEDDCSDLVSGSSSIWKDVGTRESKTNMVRKSAPFSTRLGSPSFADTCNRSNNSEWRIDFAVSKMNSIPHLQNEGSESSSGTKTQETVTVDAMSMQDTGNEYDIIDDKQDVSSSSNHVSDNFTNKFMAAVHHHSYGDDLVKSIGEVQLLEGEPKAARIQSYMPKNRNRTSLDSTITEAEESHPARLSCSQTENEIGSIRKQLLEIEKKQSILMDLLQGFTTTTMESLSVIQLKVSSLEQAVDRISHDLAQGPKFMDPADFRYVGKSQRIPSPAISMNSTPRPSVDMQEKRPSVKASSSIGICDDKTVVRSRISSTNASVDSQRRPLSMMNRNSIGKVPHERPRRDQHETRFHQSRNSDSVFTTVARGSARENINMNEKDIWKCVKGFVCEGDLESAYQEALCSGNQLLLIELIEGTGPVLDSLSNRTISGLLTAISSCLLEHRVLESAIPWLQQIVELSAIHGPNCIPLPLKVRREVLSAVQDALDAEVAHPAKRRLVAQLAMKLQQTWGKMSLNVS
ncbi:TORTIFOLIA1-like protein 2 [Silene latifolia]|uniref:TORTIFOLIA1-like protein 2 n=1 Tax=Silene latifolia TaxID=37657 RepID=UPI003D785EC3